ncbi:MAG: hypothetical protein ACM31C_17795 [Acidobacteriota bacterium]
MRTLPLFAILLAGCTGDVGPCDPAPRWQLALPANPQLAVANDGSLTIWGSDQLQRVDGDGRVTASIAIAMSNGGPSIGVDRAGAPVIALCNFIDGTGAITVYDTALAPQRTLSTPVCVGHIARGPAGQLAYTAGSTTTTTQVHALDAAGVELWAVTIDGRLDYAANGNVVVYDLQLPDLHRVELAGATGAIVSDVLLPIEPLVFTLFAPDGSYVVRSYDRTDPVGVIRRDATGAAVWERPLRSLLGVAVLASDNSVVVTADIATSVVRLDGSTGATIATTTHCTSGTTLVGATADAYLLHSTGLLSSYPGP